MSGCNPSEMDIKLVTLAPTQKNNYIDKNWKGFSDSPYEEFKEMHQIYVEYIK